jgi:NTE family protein
MAVADPVRSLGASQPAVLRASNSSRTRVALALGSGGARGYAHIGVINELQERGYQIVGVAGSSMGCTNLPIGLGR